MSDQLQNAQLQKAADILNQWALSTTAPTLNRLDVFIHLDSLLPAITALHQQRWGYLAAITGLDRGPENGKFEVLYHFCSGADVVTLRLIVERTSPSVPSICSVIPSASFFERELGEMFGITVIGTPTPAHLFLPDNWPEGVYPLRKDAPVQEG